MYQELGINAPILLDIDKYVQSRESNKYSGDRPIQKPFSRWAIEEIVWNLQMDNSGYADDIIRHFISLMKMYKDAAEVERKMLYQTAIDTAEDLYSYLFERKGETD